VVERKFVGTKVLLIVDPLEECIEKTQIESVVNDEPITVAKLRTSFLIIVGFTYEIVSCSIIVKYAGVENVTPSKAIAIESNPIGHSEVLTSQPIVVEFINAETIMVSSFKEHNGKVIPSRSEDHMPET
jgi:hypothetical protein